MSTDVACIANRQFVYCETAFRATIFCPQHKMVTIVFYFMKGKVFMNKKELIQDIANETGVEIKTVEEVFEVTIEKIVSSLKSGESVTIRNFGKFFIRDGKGKTKVFKFNPSQRLRKLFGWSSTYKGKV